MPNITGSVQNDIVTTSISTSDAFINPKYGKGNLMGTTTPGWARNGGAFNFNANSSNTIYGNSNTVTPESLATLVILKY